MCRCSSALGSGEGHQSIVRPDQTRLGTGTRSQVVGDGQFALEAGRAGLPLELLGVGVALREVGEHEVPHARVPGHPRAA